MTGRKVVAIGLIGTTLDAGIGPKRWDRWRPTMCLCQQEDLQIDRLELLFEAKSTKLFEAIKEDIAHISPETEVRPVQIEVGDVWDFERVYSALHDFAQGYAFSPETEDYLIHITTGSHVAQICLFLLTESRYFPAKLIQTCPPTHEHPGLAGTYSIIDLDLSRYDLIASRFEKEQRQGLSFLKSGIDTRNEAFNHLIERIEQVAMRSTSPILLMGATGAGKSQLARRVYELKKNRRQVPGPFVEVNCATLRGDGAMAALFGHTKGAFTGAVGERAGLLRKAHEGVLFLDEIGELGADEQAMLLRAIELKTFYPVGSDREVQSDFQLLAGTNRDLGALASQGRFREDLLARINLWTFRLPSLRERPEDIAPNLEYELVRCSKQLGVQVTFNRAARDKFLRFATSPEAQWTGNFRDFSAAILRMSTLATGGRITTELVDEEIARLKASWGPARVVPAASVGNDDSVAKVLGAGHASQLDRFDRVQLGDVLRVCQHARSLSEAGRLLFSESRRRKSSSNDADRLRKYLSRFGLDWKDLRPEMPGDEAED